VRHEQQGRSGHKRRLQASAMTPAMMMQRAAIAAFSPFHHGVHRRFHPGFHAWLHPSYLCEIRANRTGCPEG